MKHSKNIITIALLSFMLSQSAYAISDTPRTEPVEVSILSPQDSQPVVSLRFTESSAGKDFNITITDHNGFEFYSSTIKSHNQKMQFVLQAEVLDGNAITIAIIDKESGKKEMYQVDNRSIVTQTTNLVKL